MQTDVVVITAERIGHIKEHHPGDYEKYSRYIKDMVEKPGYLIRDTDPQTVIVLKQYSENSVQFRLVLSMAIVGDALNRQNSIITFLKISERTYRKYIRKYTREEKILYKSE